MSKYLHPDATAAEKEASNLRGGQDCKNSGLSQKEKENISSKERTQALSRNAELASAKHSISEGHSQYQRKYFSQAADACGEAPADLPDDDEVVDDDQWNPSESFDPGAYFVLNPLSSPASSDDDDEDEEERLFDAYSQRVIADMALHNLEADYEACLAAESSKDRKRSENLTYDLPTDLSAKEDPGCESREDESSTSEEVPSSSSIYENELTERCASPISKNTLEAIRQAMKTVQLRSTSHPGCAGDNTTDVQIAPGVPSSISPFFTDPHCQKDR